MTTPTHPQPKVSFHMLNFLLFQTHTLTLTHNTHTYSVELILAFILLFNKLRTAALMCFFSRYIIDTGFGLSIRACLWLVVGTKKNTSLFSFSLQCTHHAILAHTVIITSAITHTHTHTHSLVDTCAHSFSLSLSTHTHTHTHTLTRGYMCTHSLYTHTYTHTPLSLHSHAHTSDLLIHNIIHTHKHSEMSSYVKILDHLSPTLHDVACSKSIT